MEINFKKYSATGNDFIILDNRDLLYGAVKSEQWSKLCHRKEGVGADGVLLLETSEQFDFTMRYLNSDGGEVSMCGNGARALTHFARNSVDAWKTQKHFKFETKNGVYSSEILDDNYIRILMTEYYDVGLIDVSDLVKTNHSYYLNTGVPHCLFEVDNLSDLDVFSIGKNIRYDKRFTEGVNANFFTRPSDRMIKLRTYERGVEAETDACGTGAVAAAIFCSGIYQIEDFIEVKMNGGLLRVDFNRDYSEVYLGGKVKFIFSGSIF